MSKVACINFRKYGKVRNRKNSVFGHFAAIKVSNILSMWFKNLMIPAGKYMFKVNNRNTRIKREICSKLTIMSPERRYWRRYGVFIVNFEHVSHLVLVFLLLNLST